jgi:uncharacterized protein YPO0396
MSDIAAQNTISDHELEQTVVRYVDRCIQNTVEVSGNSDVCSGTNESAISANQLCRVFATFMAAKQAENAKLASTSESKLNDIQEESNKQTATWEGKMINALQVELIKISENLDAKLASIRESLDAKLNSVSDSLNAKLN